MARIEPTAAALERIEREKARRQLMSFQCYLAPWYTPGRHHRLVAEALAEVELYIRTKGEKGCGRLMVFEPPRHGKTEQVSRMFPAWVLGRNPDARVILTSYGADLAQDDSRAVRNYVMSERYRAVFGDRSTVDTPVEISDDSRAKSSWDLSSPHRGGVVSAGVGGGITGKGAHLLIVDDPFKNRDEAESEAYRNRVMSWWRSSAYTRLEKGGAVVITHTRWHQADLAGEMLMAMGSDGLLGTDQWKVLFLPALALPTEDYVVDENAFHENLLRGLYIPTSDLLGRKAGEALWPEKFDEAAIHRIRANVQEFEFSALYQQQPRPSSGGFFEEKDFKVIERREVPADLRWYRYVDLALGKTQTADRNATVAVAIDHEGIIYYRDMLVVRELDEFVRQAKVLMLDEAERGVVWGFEDVAFQGQVLREFLHDRTLMRVLMDNVRPEGDKVERARLLQLRARQGKVRLVRGGWVAGTMNEILGFPKGQHDDQVDTMSGGLQMAADAAAELIISGA